MNRILLVLFVATGTALAAGPAWDSTGNSQLNGTYNFRQVQYTTDGSGNISRQIAFFGTVTFSGNAAGTYAFGGNNTLLNSGASLGIPATGPYSVSASGYGFLSNPLGTGSSVYFLVSKGILIGSSTESGGSNGTFVNDLFIAAPVTPNFTNSSFSGSYTMAGFFSSLNAGAFADASVQLTADGAGKLTTANITGYRGTAAATGTQPTNVRYLFSSGTGVITFPVASLSLPTTFFSGDENVCVSPDGNFIFGGSPNTYDMFVGVRNAASGSPTLTPGLYYEAGLDVDESQWDSDQLATLDSYYGVMNAFQSNGKGYILGHERLLYAGFGAAEGVNYTTTYPTGSYTGPANVGQLDPSATVQYTIGAGGIRIGLGIGPWLGIEVAFPAPAVTPTAGAFIDPTGIVNTASSAPFTAGISPGEFITIYNGVNLAPATGTCWTAGPPFPTTLAGVQVLINGIAAPIYCVGQQITALVPYAVSASQIAAIQVSYNNVTSNVATAFVYKTAPGVFTYPAGGLGSAAAQHGDYSLITATNPARPGETIVVYLSGLGSVFPVNGVAAIDGAATGPNGDTVVSNIAVDVAGFGSTNIAYAGLTPTAAGLYQINFDVPANAPAGNDVLAIVASGSFSAHALLPVGTGAKTPSAEAVPVASHHSLPRLTTPAGVTDRRGTNPR